MIDLTPKHVWIKAPPATGVKGICANCGAKSFPHEKEKPCMGDALPNTDPSLCAHDYDPFE